MKIYNKILLLKALLFKALLLICSNMVLEKIKTPQEIFKRTMIQNIEVLFALMSLER